MSMNNYSIECYALIVSKEKVLEIFEKNQGADTWDEDDATNYARNTLELCYESEFTGDLVDMDEKGNDVYIDEISCDAEEIYYLPTERQSTLLRRAYFNIDEILEEFKKALPPDVLGEDFDYRKNFRHIIGTYYG